MEEMSASAAKYAQLLFETKPEVITGERQNQAYIRKLEELASRKSVSAAEEKLIALLTLLIEQYEAEHHSLPESSPVDVLRHLMEANHLRQKDLVDVFGTESIVSDVLNGKRDLAKEHIRRLSARFHVSPALFF
jgi:HTH-type transcriptional regulator / antitoxin HigA